MINDESHKTPSLPSSPLTSPAIPQNCPQVHRPPTSKRPIVVAPSCSKGAWACDVVAAKRGMGVGGGGGGGRGKGS